MNDITRMCHDTDISLYAGDMAIYTCGANIEIIQHKLQSDLNNIQNWLLSNKLCLNVKKCKVLKICTPQHRTRNDPLYISLNNEQLEEVNEYKYLGFWLDSTLSFNCHIDKIVKKANQRLGLIKQSFKFLGRHNTLVLYKSLVLPAIDYGDLLYHQASARSLQSLQVVQNKFARVLLKCDRYTPSIDMHNELRIMKLDRRRHFHLSVFVFKSVKGLVTESICNRIRVAYEDRGWVTRAQTRGDLYVPPVLLKLTESAFSYMAPKLWNSLPYEMRISDSLDDFKKLYFENYGYI